MAKEASELLSRLYESLADSHPDKKHIRSLLRTNEKYLAEQALQVTVFPSAYDKMRFLVENDRKNNMPYSEDAEEDQWHELEEYNEEFGEHSAFSLVPIGTTKTPFLLRIMHELQISTKDDLAGMSEQELLLVRGAGKENRIWLTTLREMAIENIAQRDKPRRIEPSR